MGTGILLNRLWRTARLASAIGIAGLLAATFPASSARAAVATASAECHGVVGQSTDTTALPQGNFRETISFTKGTPATAPKAGKTEAVAGSFILSVDQQCTGFNPITSTASTVPQTPCVQAGTFTGTIDSKGNMILAYSDPPSPAQAGTGLFDGCEETFLVMPVSSNTGAVWIPNAVSGVPSGTGNALIFQTPAPAHGTAPPTCAVAGTRMVFTCSANNF